MTDLKQLADIALRMARSDLNKTKGAGLIAVLGFPDGTTEQLPVAPFAPLLDSGKGKDLLFGAIRTFAQKVGADSVVIATECWRGRSTPAAKDMPPEEFRRLSGEHRFETLVAMGMIERVEAIVATAQNAERCVILTQEFRRDATGTVYSYGEVEDVDTPQEKFEGRQKMFGDLTEEKLR